MSSRNRRYRNRGVSRTYLPYLYQTFITELDELRTIAENIRTQLLFIAEILNMQYHDEEIENQSSRIICHINSHLTTSNIMIREVRSAILNIIFNRQPVSTSTTTVTNNAPNLVQSLNNMNGYNNTSTYTPQTYYGYQQ